MQAAAERLQHLDAGTQQGVWAAGQEGHHAERDPLARSVMPCNTPLV